MRERDERRFWGMSPIRWALGLLVALSAVGLFLFGALPAMAQDQPPEPAPPPQQTVQAAPAQESPIAIDPETGGLGSLGDLFIDSIWISGPIALLSVLAVLLFLYFFLTISPASLAPASFVDDVNKLVLAERYEDAANFCRAHRRIFVASIIQRCAENAGKTHSVIMEMLDAEGRRRADILWNRISYLADISNVAPMLGLLGTVWGMMGAFAGLEQTTGSLRSQYLGQQIGIALATTLFGLIVAIMALAFYSVTKARATRALAQAEQAVHSIADRIKRSGE